MRGFILLLVVWSLTACAGLSQQDSRSVVDWEQVGKIESAHGTRTSPSTIIWVNYPRKRVAEDAVENDS